MRRSSLVILVSVVVGAVVGGVVGLLLANVPTGVAVGVLGGLAVAFGITGIVMAPATHQPVGSPVKPREHARG